MKKSVIALVLAIAISIVSPTPSIGASATGVNFTGSTVVGSSKTVTPKWWGNNVTFSYVWYACSTFVISNSSTATFSSNYKGCDVTVKVTGRDSTSTATATYPAGYVKVQTVLNGSFSVRGTLQVGETLEAQVPSYSPSGGTVSLLWYSGQTLVSGGYSYKVRPSDFGKSISVSLVADPSCGTSNSTGPVVVSCPFGSFDGAALPAYANWLSSGTVKLGSISPSSPPVVSGTYEVGKTVTAEVGTWQSGAILNYQWLCNGSAIDGATSLQYSIQAQDFGKALRLQVTGQLDGYETRMLYSEAVLVSAGKQSVPKSPEIKGPSTVGSTVSLDIEGWDLSNKISATWMRDGIPISSATESTYVLQPIDLGHRISVRVVVSKEGFENLAVDSLARSITPGLMDPIKPRMAGVARVGQKLFASVDGQPVGATTSYVWLRQGKEIPSADGESYTVTYADVGLQISVKSKTTLVGYDRFEAISDAARVLPGLFNRRTIQLIGSPKIGNTISVKPLTSIRAGKFTYQWLLDGKAISGANMKSLNVKSLYKGRKLTLRVTESAPGYTNAIYSSAPLRIR